jgi:hypothetical protein
MAPMVAHETIPRTTAAPPLGTMLFRPAVMVVGGRQRQYGVCDYHLRSSPLTDVQHTHTDTHVHDTHTYPRTQTDNNNKKQHPQLDRGDSAIPLSSLRKTSREHTAAPTVVPILQAHFHPRPRPHPSADIAFLC